MPNIPNIESFRAAAAGSHKRLLSTRSGTLVAAKQSLAKRLIQWFRPPSQSKLQRNQDAIARFHEALAQNYGSQIAQRVYAQRLQKNFGKGFSLSSATVRSSLKDADSQMEKNTQKNLRAFAQFRKSGTYNQTLRRSLNNSPQQALDAKARTFLNLKVQQALLQHPEFTKGTMDEAQFKTLLESCTQATLEHIHPNHLASRTDATEHAQSTESKLQFLIGRLDNPSNEGYADIGNMLRNQISEIANGLDKADRKLEEAPLGDADIRDWSRETNALVDQLKDARDRLQATSRGIEGRIAQEKTRQASEPQRRALGTNAMSDMVADKSIDKIPPALRAAKKELDGKIEALMNRNIYHQNYAGSQPLSRRNVAHAQKLWIQGAENVLDAYELALRDAQANPSEAPEGSVPQNGLIVLGAARRTLRNYHTELEDFKNTRGDLSPTEVKALERKQAADVTRVLHTFNKELKDFYPPAKEITDMRALLREGRNAAIERQSSWRPIRSSVEFQLDGKAQRLDSEITPARYLGFGRDGVARGMAKDQIYGVQCSNTRSSHATNLARSTITDPISKQEIFSGVRHGVHSAIALDKSERPEANLKRAEETVAAALRANPSVLAAAIENAREGNADAVDLPMVSVSLLTPSSLPKFRKEAKMLNDQLEAWGQVNHRGPMELEVFDRQSQQAVKVKVHPKIIPMNFGVNPGAIHIGMGWGKTEQLNADGMRSLLGSLNGHDAFGGLVGKFLSREDISAEDRSSVQELAAQLRDIYNSGSYKKNDGDIYKLQSRLLVLSHKIGATPVWNCKSGKDRTGHLDAEAKALAAELHLRGGVVPQASRRQSPEEQAVLREFALRGGNHEIQRYNTGYAGYKTYNMPSNERRLGNVDGVSGLYRGLGNLAKN